MPRQRPEFFNELPFEELPVDELIEITKESTDDDEVRSLTDALDRFEEELIAKRFREAIKPGWISRWQRVEKRIKQILLIVGLSGTPGAILASYQNQKESRQIWVPAVRVHVDQSDEGKTKEQQERLRTHLAHELGKDFIWELNEAEGGITKTLQDSIDLEEGIKKTETPTLKVSNFEKIDKRTTKLIQSILEETFPKEWQNNIAEVSYTDKILLMPAGLGSKISKNALATCEGALGQNAAKIVFGLDARSTHPRYIFSQTLLHELAHAIDPLRFDDLSADERLNFMQRLTKRVQAPDRFKSAYVENIENPDLQKQQHHRATEYWAEIFSLYLENPLRVDLPERDIQLIKDYLLITGGLDFDELTAAEKRQELIFEHLFKPKIIEITRALGTIYHQDFLSKLEKYLEAALGWRQTPKAGPKTLSGFQAVELTKKIRDVWTRLETLDYLDINPWLTRWFMIQNFYAAASFDVYSSKPWTKKLPELARLQTMYENKFTKHLNRLAKPKRNQADKLFAQMDELVFSYGNEALYLLASYDIEEYSDSSRREERP